MIEKVVYISRGCSKMNQEGLLGGFLTLSIL